MFEDFLISCWFAFKQVTRSNTKSVVMTIIVMVLLFVNILFVSSMLSGAVDTINAQIIDTQYGNIVIEPNEEKRDNSTIKQVSDKLDAVREAPQIIGAAPHYKKSVKISYDDNNDGADVKEGNWTLLGINPTEEQKVTKISEDLVAGRYLNENDRDKILLGREISGGFGASFEMRSLQGVNIGDDVSVSFQSGEKRNYEVVGIFTTKDFLSDARAYVTRSEIEDVFSMHDMADEVIIKTVSTGDEEKYIPLIRNVLNDDVKIRSWEAYAGIISSTTESFNFIKLIFYGIGLTVAGISIFIIIYISLIHQRKQIGILRAIGMKNEMIVTSYVLQAFFYGVAGVLIGMLLVEYVFYPFFIEHPFTLPIGDVSLSVRSEDISNTMISMVVVSIFSGLIPSMQIVKKNILDSILR